MIPFASEYDYRHVSAWFFDSYAPELSRSDNKFSRLHRRSLEDADANDVVSFARICDRQRLASLATAYVLRLRPAGQ